MAIIYSYPQGSSALQEDRVIITRIGEEENEITTKQLTLGQIGDYIITANDIVIGTGTPNYIPMWGSDGGSIVDSPIYTKNTRVGIGTTDPSEKLDVAGNILATGTILGSNLSGTNTGDQVLPTDFVSAANGGTFGGNIFASNLSGTNTGDQDLSGFTSNTLSENVSFGESYASNYKSMVIDDGGVFFPRSLGYEIGLMKEQESFHKTTLSLLPSGVGAEKVYSIKPKNYTFDFRRLSIATYVDEDGVVQTAQTNAPRIDYSIVNGVVSNYPSLLLEPKKTNKFKNSRNLSSPNWAKSAVTIDENQLIGLEKELTVDKIVETASNNPHYIRQVGIPKTSIDGNYNFQTISGYFIPAERTVVGVDISDNLNNLIRVYVDLINLEVVDKVQNGFTNEKIIIERFNEFVFVSVTIRGFDISTSFRGHIWLAESKDNTSTVYQGVAGHGLYATSLQFEDGVYPTARINTEENYATRNQELVYSFNTSKYFNPDKGGFYIELDKIRTDTDNANITFSDFSIENEFRIFTERNSQRLRFYIMKNGVIQTNGITSVPYNTDSKNKIAFYWDDEVGEIKLFINGEYLTQADFPEGSMLDYTYFIFARANNTERFYGRVNALSLYDGQNASLSDQFFINLTKQ